MSSAGSELPTSNETDRLLLRHTIESLLQPDDKKTTQSPSGKIGVLLINTGTPAALQVSSIRSYLKQFLTDKRVIELPKAVWYPILYLFILNIRPIAKKKSYGLIWNRKTDESPLRTIIKSQAVLLQARFNKSQASTPVVVDWAFRYGGPSIEEKVKALVDAGCDRIVSFPLFPQFSATTVASCHDEVFNALKSLRNQPAVHTIRSYYAEGAYVNAIAQSVAEALGQRSSIKFDLILFTYHGIPLKYEQSGDPYGQQCRETTELVKKLLRTDVPVGTAFQSRFGPSVWLKPYTDPLIQDLAKTGCKNIMLVAPGFSTDCLETLEEIVVEMQTNFVEKGGEKLVYVPCLNDSDAGINVIETVARKSIQSFL